jgi:hypothetical protein
MQKSYPESRAWADSFLPEIKKIVGPLLIEPAPMDLDVDEVTDLVVVKAKDFRVACRVRSFKHLKAFGDEFTIRASVTSGQPTEIHKIANRFGDWFFYGLPTRMRPALRDGRFST